MERRKKLLPDTGKIRNMLGEKSYLLKNQTCAAMFSNI